MVKTPPYTLFEAVERLQPQLGATVADLEQLPSLARPQGEAVALVTMHPQASAYSDFPDRLVRHYNLRRIGSRVEMVQPQKWTFEHEPAVLPTVGFYLAGPMASFGAWAKELSDDLVRPPAQIRGIESVRMLSAGERLRRLPDGATNSLLTLEVLLHASAGWEDQFIVAGFSDYAASLGVELDSAYLRHVGGMGYWGVQITPGQATQLAQFAFLRSASPLAPIDLRN